MVNLIPLTLSLKGGKWRSPECSYGSLEDAVNYVDDCCAVGGEECPGSSYVIKKINNFCMVSFTPKLSPVLDDIGWWRTVWITAILMIWGEKWRVGIFTDLKAYIFIFWPDFILAKVISKKSFGFTVWKVSLPAMKMHVCIFRCTTCDCRYYC